MLESYLRITFLNTQQGTPETFFIRTDKAGFIDNTLVKHYGSKESIDNRFIIRHELLNEKIIRHLSFEPLALGTYKEFHDEDNMFIDDMLALLESEKISHPHLFDVLQLLQCEKSQKRKETPCR